ncbi:hypothetical protein RB200_37925 [Streptomyces sp. PmtG]
MSTLLAGFSSAGSGTGSQGALELPEASVATMTTAYPAQARPTRAPSLRYRRLRRPVSSTNTGPSATPGVSGTLPMTRVPPTPPLDSPARCRPTPSIWTVTSCGSWTYPARTGGGPCGPPPGPPGPPGPLAVPTAGPR